MSIKSLNRSHTERFLASMLGVLGTYDEVHDLNVMFDPPVLGVIESYYLSSDTMCVYVEFECDVVDINNVNDHALEKIVERVIALHNDKFPTFQYE